MGGVSRFCPQRSSVWAGWLTTPATTNCCFSQVGNFYRASFASIFFGKFTAIFCIKKGTIFSKNQTGVCFFFFLILKGPDFVIIIWWGLLTEEQLEASEPRNPENQKPENSNLAKAQPPTHSLAIQLHLSNLFDRQNNKHIWARKTHK